MFLVLPTLQVAALQVLGNHDVQLDSSILKMLAILVWECSSVLEGILPRLLIVLSGAFLKCSANPEQTPSKTV